MTDLRNLALCLLLISINAAVAAPGDLWEVQDYSSNLRIGPGTEHGVFTQRGRGDVVMELRRDGEWLNVAIDHAGRTAWIHRDLLERMTALPGKADPSPNFDGFARLFDPEHPDNQFGTPAYFRAPVHLEFGVVRVDAVPEFFELDEATRGSHMDSLLRLWVTVDNSGFPGTVIIRDAEEGTHRIVHSGFRGTHHLNDL